MIRNVADRQPEGMCANPWIAKPCGQCKRNRSQNPGAWSATPDVTPRQEAHGTCAYFVAIPVRVAK